MIKIYHAPNTRSIRVIWLCKELDLPHEVESVPFTAEFRASPEWRKINPVGKIPVLVDRDLTLFESGAMVQYLLDRYGNGRLQPTLGTPKHAFYQQWSWFAEATFARPLGEVINHRREFPGDKEIPAAVEEMKNRARLCLQAVDDELAQKDFIVGEFTAADIMLGYTLHLCGLIMPMDEYANVSNYWLRLKNRPALQETLALN